MATWTKLVLLRARHPTPNPPCTDEQLQHLRQTRPTLTLTMMVMTMTMTMTMKRVTFPCTSCSIQGLCHHLGVAWQAVRQQSTQSLQLDQTCTHLTCERNLQSPTLAETLTKVARKPHSWAFSAQFSQTISSKTLPASNSSLLGRTDICSKVHWQSACS